MNDFAKAKQTRKSSPSLTKRVELRITDEQFQRIHALSAASVERGGRPLSLSELVRASLDDGCERIAQAIEALPSVADADAYRHQMEAFDGAAESLREVRTDLRRIGNNVNQIARVANESGTAPEGLIDVAQELKILNARMLEIGEHFVRASDGKTRTFYVRHYL